MRTFLPQLTVSENIKGVLDVDTVKGCRLGMAAYPRGGCYGLCYAYRIAVARGFDFSTSVSRAVQEHDRRNIVATVLGHHATWFRIGVMGDPCHDWELTCNVCEWLCAVKTPVVVTKHWIAMPQDVMDRMIACRVVFNTSISPLDTECEIRHRLEQFDRISQAGGNSVLRIVSCMFGETDTGRRLSEVQARLFSKSRVIDNPLRVPRTDARVVRGDIVCGENGASVFNDSTYMGVCRDCPDQCGVSFYEKEKTYGGVEQLELWKQHGEKHVA